MFPITPGKDYAVITGDIIDSSSLEAEQRRKLPKLIHDTSGFLAELLGADATTPIAIFGGDSWQVLLDDPTKALRAAVFVRACLLGSPFEIDSRMAIAIGGIDFLPEAGIEEADGEAFRLSGRLLAEAMGPRRSMAIVRSSPAAASHWNLVLRLIDALIRLQWTPSRARAVSGAIRGWSGEQTGQLWPTPISKQTVARHLAEAGWDALEEALVSFEAKESP